MGYDWSYNRSSTIFSALLSDSIATNFTGPRQSFQPYRLDTNTRYQSSTIFSVLSDSIQNNITGPRQTFQSYRTRYKQTLPVLDIFSLIGLDTNTRYRSSTIFSALSDYTNNHYRSSAIFSALSDSIQMNITGPRQSFQPYWTRYKQPLLVHDNLFSLIGLDTNKLYRSSTILSALSDSIQITITGPRQSFQLYRTRYKQTLPVLDNRFSLIGLDTNEG